MNEDRVNELIVVVFFLSKCVRVSCKALKALCSNQHKLCLLLLKSTIALKATTMPQRKENSPFDNMLKNGRVTRAHAFSLHALYLCLLLSRFC